jgi:hypothetical protein
VAGGGDGTNYHASAEIYDSSLGSWSITGSLHEARFDHTATLLNDGRVLVAGGYNQGPLASAEIYDATMGVWSETGSLEGARNAHTATLLDDGRVLVAGGVGYQQVLSSAEIYDPLLGTWASAGSLTNARFASVAFLLPEGDVLVAGRGCTEPHECEVYPDTEIYDPSSNTWTLGPPMNRGRFAPSAVTLPSGKWLVAGGSDWAGEGYTSEFYNEGSWALTGSFQQVRNGPGVALLSDGRVLASGGYEHFCYSCYPIRDTAELYDERTGQWDSAPGTMASPRSWGHILVALPDGTALVAGGSVGPGQYLALVEVFCPPERGESLPH